jgi:signal transduction histidine kinase
VDYLEKFVKHIALSIFVYMMLVGGLATGLVWLGLTYLPEIEPYLVIATVVVLVVLVSFVLAQYLANYVTKPLKQIWQAVLHVSPGHGDTPPPNVEEQRVARDLVKSLVLQIYQLASLQNRSVQHQSSAQSSPDQSKTLNNLPVPLFIMNTAQQIIFVNQAAAQIFGVSPNEIVHKNLYDILDLSFTSEDTFDSWLKQCRESKATDTHTWEHVKLVTGEKTRRQFDMAAFYTKADSNATETIVTFFDKTKQYEANDDDIEFISLAVHELRTPLTMLRGYIEIFEDELADQLDEELADYMVKMRASAEQLTVFVTNILNVARVEENQLFLHLHEEQWAETLNNIIKDIEPRAKAHGYEIELSIQHSMPTVAVDKVSISEVIGNLIDNAIKYSTENKKIIVRSYLRDDGQVETTVQDFGIGIPNSIIGNLFEKFYRNHRSKAQVGGTGLGLYLSKAIVSAHGGQIWVKSKEGEGSVFGFSLQNYADLADELKSSDNKDIKRTAYGWIKNHSFYRK